MGSPTKEPYTGRAGEDSQTTINKSVTMFRSHFHRKPYHKLSICKCCRQKTTLRKRALKGGICIRKADKAMTREEGNYEFPHVYENTMSTKEAILLRSVEIY